MPPKKKKIRIKVAKKKSPIAATVPVLALAPVLEGTPLKELPKDTKLFHNSDTKRVLLDGWILPSNKQFLNFIRDIFRRATVDQVREPMKLWNTINNEYKDVAAYKHQKFVSDFISENSPYRGLLLYHGLGSGKSGASIMISEGLKHRHVVIMLPASLKDNYKHELQTFADISYKKNYNWKFINLDDITSVETKKSYADAFVEKGVSEELFDKILKTHVREKSSVQGIWMIQYNLDPNYDSLQEYEQKEISDQIDIMFNYRYSILHYNSGQYTITKLLEKLIPNYKSRIFNQLFGPEKKVSSLTNNDRDLMLNYIYDSANNIDNPFNNKVLVIDEIHNLTSGMIGSGYNGRRLYELIMRAENLKVIFLSGTPVINSAYELGLMFNMLRGLIKSYSINLEKKIGIFNVLEIKEILDNNKFIDISKIYEDRRVVEIIRIPHGFKKNIGTDYVVPAEDYIPDQEFITSLLTSLSDKGYQRRGDISANYYTIFPDMLTKRQSNTSMLGTKSENDVNQELFNNNYINTNSLEVVNQNQFKNRIFGLISFYNEISKEKLDDPDIFPTKETALEEETTVVMSNFQFIEYAAKREIERKLEKRSSQFKSKGSEITGDVPSLFRVFSRQKGLFVFPPTIKRPMPPKKDDEIKKSIVTAISKEEIDEIALKLKEIFKSGGDLSNKIKKYLETISEEYNHVAEELIQKFYIKGTSGQDYDQWLTTYQFNESDFMNTDMNETSNEIENDYYTDCRLAIDQLTDSNLRPYTDDDTGELNLLDLSPKYVKILENIDNTPGLVFCYSQFRSVEGIEIFGKILQTNGYSVMEATSEKEIICDYTITKGSKVRYAKQTNIWRTYTVNEVKDKTVILDSIDGEIPITEVHKCAYALWTGTESPDQRRAILDVYTNESNMYGQKCLIFLTTQSGAEGISLFFVRQVHIMEPYWNNVRIEQVIGRSRRIKSHILLPKDQQNVKIFTYIIKYSDSQLNGSWIEDMSPGDIELMKDGEDNGFDTAKTDEDEDLVKAFRNYAVKLSGEINVADKGKTSDEVLYDISIRKKRILDRFLTLMKESAIDCQFNRVDNIRSDSTIEDAFRCPTAIISDSNYTYDVFESSTTQPRKKHKEQTLMREQGIKKLSIPVILQNSKIKVLIILPPELNGIDKQSIIAKLPNNLEIYDYYLYNSLYYKKRTEHGDKFIIGSVINTEINPIRHIKDLSKFINIREEITKDYRRIEACIKEVGRISKPTELERINWTDRIKMCHEKKDTELKLLKQKAVSWKCQVCEGETTVEICPNCGISREDTLAYTSAVDKKSSSPSLKLSPQTPLHEPTASESPEQTQLPLSPSESVAEIVAQVDVDAPPVPVDELPVPVKKPPVPVEELPVPVKKLPVPVKNPPVPVEELPVPVEVAGAEESKSPDAPDAHFNPALLSDKQEVKKPVLKQARKARRVKF